MISNGYHSGAARRRLLFLYSLPHSTYLQSRIEYIVIGLCAWGTLNLHKSQAANIHIHSLHKSQLMKPSSSDLAATTSGEVSGYRVPCRFKTNTIAAQINASLMDDVHENGENRWISAAALWNFETTGCTLNTPRIIGKHLNIFQAHATRYIDILSIHRQRETTNTFMSLNHLQFVLVFFLHFYQFTYQ